MSSTAAPLAAAPSPTPTRTLRLVEDFPDLMGPGIQVDTDVREVSVDGRQLELTYLEFELLAHLVQHPRRVHTREQLVSGIWGYAHVGDGRTVDVHIARLRRKLGAAHRSSIVTVRRVGYKFLPGRRG